MPVTIKPHKLKDIAVSKINNRIKDELDAMSFYRAASNWCQNAGFEEAASFFAEESESEFGHSKKLQEFLVGWNCVPEIPAVDKPNPQFADLIDVFNQAYQLEYLLYEYYEKDSMEIFNSGDPCTYDFLGKFRKIQSDSVKEYSDFLNEIVASDGENNKFALYHWQQHKFGK